MIYLVRIVLHLALEVSLLVSVSWQDRDQDTNFQNRGQDQGNKNLARGITSLPFVQRK